jgi:hypothetical protein
LQAPELDNQSISWNWGIHRRTSQQDKILAAATMGERDPAKLCAFALNALDTKAKLARKGFW